MTRPDAPSTPTPADPSRLADLLRRARLAWRLLRDPRMPLPLKLIPGLAVLYVLSPIDLLPDTIPVVTQIDDMAILLLALKLFLDMAPADVRQAAERGGGPEGGDDVVPASYRVHED